MVLAKRRLLAALVGAEVVHAVGQWEREAASLEQDMPR